MAPTRGPFEEDPLLRSLRERLDVIAEERPENLVWLALEVMEAAIAAYSGAVQKLPNDYRKIKLKRFLEEKDAQVCRFRRTLQELFPGKRVNFEGVELTARGSDYISVMKGILEVENLVIEFLGHTSRKLRGPLRDLAEDLMREIEESRRFISAEIEHYNASTEREQFVSFVEEMRRDRKGRS